MKKSISLIVTIAFVLSAVQLVGSSYIEDFVRGIFRDVKPPLDSALAIAKKLPLYNLDPRALIQCITQVSEGVAELTKALIADPVAVLSCIGKILTEINSFVIVEEAVSQDLSTFFKALLTAKGTQESLNAITKSFCGLTSQIAFVLTVFSTC